MIPIFISTLNVPLIARFVDVVGKIKVVSTKKTSILSFGPGFSRKDMSSGFDSRDVSPNMYEMVQDVQRRN